MIIAIVILALLVLIGCLLLNKQFQAKKRRIRLQQANLVFTWDEAEVRMSEFNKIVETNFGYGKEVWAVSGDVNEVELGLRAFKIGILIYPRPAHSGLKQHCQTHSIKFTQTLVK